MGYINIFVKNDAHLRIDQKQLVLTNSFNEDRFPLEDINAVLIENLQSTITTNLLSKLSEYKVITYICDEKHLPNAYLLPCYNNSTIYPIFKSQNGISPVLKKQLWKTIVSYKIKNQAKCLSLSGISNNLDNLVLNVKSGDSSNVEAEAAAKYFKFLFGKDFNRKLESNVNAALNYGYAIIRGAIARSVVVHGLLPFLGIHHINPFNNFNLVDDLIEPFRPFVDLAVKKNEDIYFNHEYKGLLFNLLNVDCFIDNGKYSLQYAIEIFVNSFVKSISEGKDFIKFPELIHLGQHQYE